MAGTSRKTNLIVTLSAIGVVLVSIVVTLYASGILLGGRFGSEEPGYQNVTFTDAVMSCHKRTKSVYGNDIRTLVTDNHSSRFSEKNYIYKIFLKLDLYTKDRTSGSPHFINCFVRAKNGKISKFEVLADKEGSTVPAYDDGTNMFGIKKRKD